MIPFDIANWFWCIGGDQSKIWSSAKASFVQPTSAEYRAFVANGGAPTSIATLDDLATVFTAQYPAGMLTTYANWRQWAKAIGGYIATIEGMQVPFSTSPESMSLISGKAQRLAQPDAPASLNWQIGPSTFIEISAGDFITMATEIADFVQSTFDTLKNVMTSITADPPAITMIAQIDAAFSA